MFVCMFACLSLFISFIHSFILSLSLSFSLCAGLALSLPQRGGLNIVGTMSLLPCHLLLVWLYFIVLLAARVCLLVVDVFGVVASTDILLHAVQTVVLVARSRPCEREAFRGQDQ